MISHFSIVRLAVLIFCSLTICSSDVFSQVASKSIFVGGGISTSWINGANIARNYLRDAGGGLYGQQTGFTLRGRFTLDADQQFRAIGGLDLTLYNASERLSFGTQNLIIRHSSYTPTLLGGIEYIPFRISRYANLYTSAEVRLAFFPDNTFESEYLNIATGEVISANTRSTKKAATRLGAAVKIGAEGYISKNVRADFSIGYGLMNIVGRDDTRGELLSANDTSIIPESKENYLGNIIITMMVMFRL